MSGRLSSSLLHMYCITRTILDICESTDLNWIIMGPCYKSLLTHVWVIVHRSLISFLTATCHLNLTCQYSISYNQFLNVAISSLALMKSPIFEFFGAITTTILMVLFLITYWYYINVVNTDFINVSRWFISNMCTNLTLNF